MLALQTAIMNTVMIGVIQSHSDSLEYNQRCMMAKVTDPELFSDVEDGGEKSPSTLKKTSHPPSAHGY